MQNRPRRLCAIERCYGFNAIDELPDAYVVEFAVKYGLVSSCVNALTPYRRSFTIERPSTILWSVWKKI